VGVTVPTPHSRDHREPASERGESARHGLAPGPPGQFRFLPGGRPGRVVFTRPLSRARRRSLSSSGTGAFRTALASRLRLPPLGGPVPWRSGITPGTPASRNGGLPSRSGTPGVARDCIARKIVQTPVCDFSGGDRLAARKLGPRGPRSPQVTGLPPADPVGLPEEFVSWSTPRGLAPAPRPGLNRRGRRPVCARLFRPRRRAERRRTGAVRATRVAPPGLWP